MAQFFFPEKSLIQPDYSETARYLGYKKINMPDEMVQTQIENCAKKMYEVLQPRSTYDIYDLCITEDDFKIQFADVSFHSKDLCRNLTNCKKVAIFAATIGPLVDSLIRKTEVFSPAEAAVLQATGAMYIEKVVDLLNEKIQQEASSAGFSTKPRFSPGYGDVPLTMQKEFFRLLPCSKIGLTLMNTLIMAPEKSVTAFIGFY